jgi:gamma-glutamyltranspeptidase
MLASDGLDSFYRGPLAERLAQGMAALGMPSPSATCRPTAPGVRRR